LQEALGDAGAQLAMLALNWIDNFAMLATIRLCWRCIYGRAGEFESRKLKFSVTTFFSCKFLFA
jgi:hypothetical protein